MQRYVALVVEEPGCWTVLFPEFPGVEVSGFPLHMALWRAQRELAMRAGLLHALGLEMTAPMSTSEIVSDPGYRGAMPFHHRHAWREGAGGCQSGPMPRV